MLSSSAQLTPVFFQGWHMFTPCISSLFSVMGKGFCPVLMGLLWVTTYPGHNGPSVLLDVFFPQLGCLFFFRFLGNLSIFQPWIAPMGLYTALWYLMGTFSKACVYALWHTVSGGEILSLKELLFGSGVFW